MKRVAVITPEQAEALTGECFCGSSRFNPKPYHEGQYFISEREVKMTDNPKFWWVNSLPLVEYIKFEEDVDK